MPIKPRPLETDLYPPVRDYLLALGYGVRAEVRGCDVVASRDEELVVVELKRSFSADLLIQATERQRLTDSVYVALPAPRGGRERARWRGVTRVLQRLELGLILVSFAPEGASVEVAFHPLPHQRRRNARERRAVLTEFGARSGDYNRGGSSRQPLMTVYRETALYLAYCLSRCGDCPPRLLRALGCGPKTLSILRRDHYGWFEHVARGVYRLRPAGQLALDAHPELCQRFGSRIALAGNLRLEGGIPPKESIVAGQCGCGGAAAKKDLVVSCKKDGKWIVKPEGARCASVTVKTRAEAEAWAQEAAAKEGVQVVVQE